MIQITKVENYNSDKQRATVVFFIIFFDFCSVELHISWTYWHFCSDYVNLCIKECNTCVQVRLERNCGAHHWSLQKSAMHLRTLTFQVWYKQVKYISYMMLTQMYPCFCFAIGHLLVLHNQNSGLYFPDVFI